MKISFDVQPVLDSTKTGIGFHADGLIGELIKSYPHEEYYLNCFSLGEGEVEKKLNGYLLPNRKVSIRNNTFIPYKIYRFLYGIFPIGYDRLLGSMTDISHFFNFCIPCGVHGKTVVTIHDMAFKKYPETVRFRTRLLLFLNIRKTMKRADAIIAVSETTKKDIIEYYPKVASKIYVVSNGVDLARYSNKIDSGLINILMAKYQIIGRYLLYMGTLEPRKNLVRLIGAYDALCETMEDCPQLVIAGGKGWLDKEIIESVHRAHHKERIRVIGYVADDEAPVLMAGAHAFCFPSLYEGFGMPALEAMACGTPVIVSKGTALEEIVGDAGVLVDPLSIDSIENGLKKIVFDAELRNKLQKAGLERAKNYTWEKAGRELHEVYEKLNSTGL